MRWLLLLALVACTDAAAFYTKGECPDDREPGERWSPPNTCMECYCDNGGYGCIGCGLVAQDTGCKIVVNNTLKHPDCCPRLMCPPPVTGR